MHTYKSIAVGTDGSPTSLVAVRAAASLARVYDAKLTVICAHYTASGSMLNATNAELSKIDIVTESGAEDILRRAKAIAVEEQAPEINLVSSGGQPANVLLESVKEYSVDLLVVGNKGMRSLAGRVFGNIPGSVAKKAPVDVMLVDTRAEGHD
ncbi:stress protein [Corynebacterium sp. NML98-0116]|uniref:Universal stress protein n=2 Tax=Corynebacterium TaxID=1716 RepID=A0ABD4TS06_9CORY|nr:MULTISPECIES: universal stress protein [Corynebacterium]AOX05665.1 stress protein [Corynebacterium sp. NML98-0116]MCO6395260.1 universal stress protein [Corynebacterium lipophilum]MCQ4608513.1 universal stress protein [Corynebacterium pseudogenitalium]MCQ4610157.1 universal stress protein [Corynebacterium sp. CCUG 61414]MCQ4612840.1 universal stress protein [Corynebacterium sp. CCUG 51687]